MNTTSVATKNEIERALLALNELDDTYPARVVHSLGSVCDEYWGGRVGKSRQANVKAAMHACKQMGLVEITSWRTAHQWRYSYRLTSDGLDRVFLIKDEQERGLIPLVSAPVGPRSRLSVLAT